MQPITQLMFRETSSLALIRVGGDGINNAGNCGSAASKHKSHQTTSELSPDFFIPVTDVVVSDEFESVDSYKAYRSKLASPNSLSLAHLC